MVGGGFINTQVFGLAWYETYQYNAPKVYAISDDGQRTRVPSNFFGVNSLLFTTNIYMFEQFLKLEKCGLLENMNTYRRVKSA